MRELSKYFALLLLLGAANNPPKYGLGATSARTEVYNNIPSAAGAPVTRAAAVDLSSFMPRPGNQGAQSSCVGWALAYAARSFIEGQVKRGSWHLDNDQGTFSPSFLYNQIQTAQTGSCDGKTGLSIAAALQFMADEGAVTLSQFPYTPDCKTLPSRALMAEGQQYKITRFEVIGAQGAVPLSKVIDQLEAGHPVIAGIDVEEAFMSYGGGILQTYAGPQENGHAVVIVGFNRDEQYIKILNSWGPEWGELGYVRIAFNTAQALLKEAYVITDVAATRSRQGQPFHGVQPSQSRIVPSPIENPVLSASYRAMFDAVAEGDLASVKRAIGSGLRGDVRAGYKTGMDLAIGHGRLDILNAFIEAGGDVNVGIDVYGNLLNMAGSSGTERDYGLAMFKRLLAAGAKVNILDSHGYSLLCSTARGDEVYNLLIARGGRCISPEARFG